MNTPNYKETTIAGDQWTRASQVFIDNNLGKAPKAIFTETEVSVIGGKTIVTHVASLECESTLQTNSTSTSTQN